MAGIRQTKGVMAENWAQAFLEQRGYTLLARNFKTKLGEIDLILRDRTDLLFVEVRLKTQRQCGTAMDSIDYSKQKRIIRASESFLKRAQLPEFQNYRFDVICFQAQINPTPYKIAEQFYSLHWIKNAILDCT